MTAGLAIAFRTFSNQITFKTGIDQLGSGCGVAVENNIIRA